MPHQSLGHFQTSIALSDDDRSLVAGVPKKMRAFDDRERIVRAGDRSSHCALLVEGFAVREMAVAGKNQILALYVAGDAPDLTTLHLPVLEHDLTSAGSSIVAFISHADMRTILEHSRSLTNALWQMTLIDAAIYREWVANVGARNALARVAHLICELASRLEIVGLLKDAAFRVPFTQSDLADACSLSAVHVNRTLQELRHRGLIRWKGQTVTC